MSFPPVVPSTTSCVWALPLCYTNFVHFPLYQLQIPPLRALQMCLSSSHQGQNPRPGSFPCCCPSLSTGSPDLSPSGEGAAAPALSPQELWLCPALPQPFFSSGPGTDPGVLISGPTQFSSFSGN